MRSTTDLGASTLVEALDAVEHFAFDAAMHFPESGDTLTYADLAQASRSCANGFIGDGVRPGDVVGLLAGTGPLTWIAFFGALRCGAAVSMLPTPVGFTNSQAIAARLARIITGARMRHVAVTDELRALGEAAVAGLPTVSLIAPTTTQSAGRQPLVTSEDLAVIQYTSGSTGNPRGVMLSHRSAMAGLRAIVHSAQLGPPDVHVQWVPHYHDMGLFGLLAHALVGNPTHVFSPMGFIRRQSEFLRYHAECGGTSMTGPNFAYDLLLDRLKPDGLDFRSWRLAFNGAEPVDPATVERFGRVLEPLGAGPSVMYPVYGMAEATLAVTFPVPGEPPRVVGLDAKRRAAERLAVPVGESTSGVKSLVSCGRPVLGMDVRIVAENGEALSQNQIGEIQIRGEAVTEGYYLDAAATAECRDGGWWRTGDLGCRIDGDLFIAGRRKEMSIVNGQNYFPDDIERVARDVAGVRQGRCVAVPDTGPDGRECVAVIAESQLAEADRAGLAASIRERVIAEIGIPHLEVHIVPARWLTRTTSGKWERLAARRRIRSDSV